MVIFSNFCVFQAEDFPAMGRFTIRDEGKTIAMGLIKKIIE